MMTGTFAVSSGVNLVMSYVSATVLQLTAWRGLWDRLLVSSSTAPVAASSTDTR